MSDNTKISWSDATANVINGCSLESPGCAGCYAMKQAHRFPVRQGLTVKTKGGMVWTGEVRFHEPALIQVLRWSRPRAIFWNAHGDIFHPSVPDAWIDRCFAGMALTPQHFHQVLTKRSGRMREYFAGMPQPRWMKHMKELALIVPKPDIVDNKSGGLILSTVNGGQLPNVWLGVSVEDQKRAEERIHDLLRTPAAVRWISAEPLLGPLDLNAIRMKYWQLSALDNRPWISVEDGRQISADHEGLPKLDWVVVGGESGPKARPINRQWVRSLLGQCSAADVPFHYKQHGEWFPYGELDADGHQNSMTKGERPGFWHEWPDGGFSVKLGKKLAGRYLDGVIHDAMPAAMEQSS